MPTNLKQRFQTWSDAVEARFGAWPTWKKLVVFMPVLVLMSAVLVAVLGLGAAVMQALTTHR